MSQSASESTSGPVTFGNDGKQNWVAWVVVGVVALAVVLAWFKKK